MNNISPSPDKKLPERATIKRDEAAEMPLSPAQQSIWLAQTLEPDDAAYNIGECVEILGPVELQRFEFALRRVVETSDALHLRIFETDDGPRQSFSRDPGWELVHLDFSTAVNSAEAADAWMRNDMARPFRPDCRHLFRFALLKISADRYFWYAVNHHLVNDGVGWRHLLARVAAAYTAMMRGTPPATESVGSWRELLDEELAYRHSDQRRRDQAFWKEQLADLPPQVALSGKPARKPSGFIKSVGWIPLAADLDAAGRRLGVSPAAVLMAATSIYLHGMTGERDMMIGLPVGARVGPRMRSTVGIAVNTVPLRMSVLPDDQIGQLVERAGRGMRAALRHQRYRYEDMRRDLGLLPRDGELTSTFVNYIPLDEDITFNDAKIIRKPLGNWRVEDIQIVFYGGNRQSGQRIDLIGNPALYSQEELARHCDRIVNLVSQMAVLPADTPVARLPVFSPAERQQVVYGWNDTNAEYPSDRCIHELFEAQAVKTPKSVAVAFEDEQVSYAELNARANRLAHWLIAKGVKPDERVAIALARGVEMVVALLAALKAGGAYVPLDLSYPAERLQFMLQDSAPRVLLAQEAVLAAFDEIPAGISVLTLDGAGGSWRECSPLNPDPRAMGLTSSNLAYVIYTSGSTGTPKGVMVEHRSLQASTDARLRAYGGYKKLLLFSSLSFDSSVASIFGTITSGGALFLMGPEAVTDPELIGRRLADWQITSILAVPSLLNALVEECGSELNVSLEQISTGGEPCTEDLVDKIASWAPQAGLFNEYGPTEATVWATMFRCSPGQSRGLVPIGKPIANARIYILDGAGEPVPVGVTGEIYIGGAGVARGYLNQPELTSERFLRDPFAAERGEAGACMYRTGDLGRWVSDGNIEFLGRNDDQVKIRGVRVELGEIEVALRKVPGVRDAAVVAREDGLDSRRLVAFLTCDPSGSPAESSLIRAELAKQLPDAFIPSTFAILPELPRLPNGKLDRRALLESEVVIAESRAGAAPLRTPTELVLAEIWSEILRRPVVNRDADYFELGGDSLLAAILMTRIHRVFGIDLPLKEVFETRGLHALAKRIDARAGDHRQETMPAIERVHDGGPTPLSFSQHRMWLIQSLDPDSTAYNMSVALKLTGSLDVDALSLAIDESRRRHEILRTTYKIVGEEIVQQVAEWQSEALEVVDLTEISDSPEAEAVRRANAQASTPIDLAKGPIFTSVLMRLGPDEHLLLMTLHHIAGDQWSFGVLGRELAMLYNAARKRRAADLPAGEIRYRDFGAWQQKWLDSPEMTLQMEYWRRTLAHVPPIHLPTDHQRPRLQSFNGTYCQVDFPPAILPKLEQLGRREATTLFMTMFAGFVILLHRLTGQTDIAVAVPIANRTHSAVENIVGTFVNTLVLRVDLSGDPTFSDLLGRVRAIALDAFAHQDMPFEKLVREVVQARDTSRAPLAQVMFNMLNAPMHGIELEGIEWKHVLIDRGGAQFELSLSVDSQVSNTIMVEYNTDLFARSTIDLFIERYLCLLEGAVAEPKKRLSELQILSPSERQLVLRTWNDTSVPPPPRPFIALFGERAAQASEEPAVTFEGTTLTYGELNSQANALALELSALGAGRGSVVGVCLERSLDMLVALLAVQKSGSTYVPLDPKLPQQRLEYMVSDSGLRLLISTGETVRELGLNPEVKVIDVQALDLAHRHVGSPASEALPSVSDAAYIIYTSGSTGKPKGVVVSHGALANFLCSMQKQPGLTAADVLAAVTTISFDIAGLELYLPLLVGARIELVPSATASDGYTLSQLLGSSGATIMQATPATWRMLLDAGWQGGKNFRAFCGGEALSRELANPLLESVRELWNLYGPTETTIWSTACRVVPGDGPISIGKPIDNTRVYLLNGDMPAPIGVAGEICIGGDGVAAGYHARPDLTAERFQADPFVNAGGARIYRTGDLGRWDVDGQLHHMGRMDHQVKVRGFRIEPGEIEAAVLAHPSVRDVVVVAREVGPSDTRLVAYVVYDGATELTVSDMRRHLRQALPEYMVPSLIVALDRMPLTPNGKIDRRQLPDPFATASVASSNGEAPAPGMEKTIADLWREILQLDTVGAEDNFFDLGGHSLLALRVVAQIEKRIGVRLDPRVLFFQNLRQIAAGLADAKVSG